MNDLIILTHVPTEAVNAGFIPAAKRLGLSVTVLTDHADEHRRHFATSTPQERPEKIIACDVFNPLAVTESIGEQRPRAIFSNSDHLQASTAIAASYYDLPAKSWQAAYRAKNKAAMRAFLAATGQEQVWHTTVHSCAELTALEDVSFPCIVKPREGVGSQHVRKLDNRDDLAHYCESLWTNQPGRPLLLEEYIEGQLCTLETLGDGDRLLALGGWQVTLGPGPHFVELEARWGHWLDEEQESALLGKLAMFGIGFGACHTEFVLTEQGPRLIEINYRSVGDRREFLLDEMLNFSLFEAVLRLHLGEGLPELASDTGAASIRYFPAQRAGELINAPESFERSTSGCMLRYRSLRAAGDRLDVTHSNKDYLGVLSGRAADAAELDRAMQAAQGELAWEIA